MMQLLELALNEVDKIPEIVELLRCAYVESYLIPLGKHNNTAAFMQVSCCLDIPVAS